MRRALEPLAPQVVEVADLSCAQLQRRLLGPRRYWYRHVKQEKQPQHGKCRWEAQYYVVKCRKSTAEKLRASSWHSIARLSNEDVQLTHLGFYDTEKAATTAYDNAVRARGAANPLTGAHFVNSELPIHLVKYFQVKVVSEHFTRMTQMQRLHAVYELLLGCETLSSSPTDEQELINEDMPHIPVLVQVKGISWIGRRVEKLPIWRFLTSHFIIRAMAPAQWTTTGRVQQQEKSYIERFELRHSFNDSLKVNPTAVPVYRDLALLVAESNQESSEAASVLPHFYHGLPDELKRMIAEEQAKASSFMKGTSTTATSSSMISKLAKNTEGTFVRNYLKRRREFAQAATKLQLQFLLSMQSKALKLMIQRHFGAMTMQRLYRGHMRRQFVGLYFRVATCAAAVIQSVYRSFVSRQDTQLLRKEMVAATIAIQRLYRGHRAREFFRWACQMQKSAIVAERLVRGFMARRRVYRIRRARYRTAIVIPAARLIQRVWRGHQARVFVGEKRRIREKLEIFMPAALRIETLVRGFLARRLTKRYRCANEAALFLQRLWRQYRFHLKWRSMLTLRHQHLMAARIGALGRGYIARKFVARELRRRYFLNVMHPSAVTIQRVYRGYIGRRVEARDDRVEAAITLQEMWRRRSNIKNIKEKLRGFRESIRQTSASKIQRGYQCYQARQQLLYLRLAYQGTYGKGAVAIQSAWRSHCSREALKKFRFCSIIERKAHTLTTTMEEREMIEFDLLDARADLKRIIRYKAKSLRRIKELKVMRIDWERRQPVVEKELSQLTEEDIDRGWGEAFLTEKHVLHYSLELSVEDILSRKEQTREYEVEIEDLRLEIEDLERDLEECVLFETSELEGYREFEMAHAAQMFIEERARRVQHQRIRWKVKNVRKNVILRERANIGFMEKQFLESRSVSELGALAFGKKQMIDQKLQHVIMCAVDSRDTIATAARESAREQTIVNGFNSAVERMSAITKEYSYQYRIPKSDLREDPNSSMCQICGRINCDCDVIEGENQPTRVPSSATDAQVTKSKTRNRLARRWKYQD